MDINGGFSKLILSISMTSLLSSCKQEIMFEKDSCLRGKVCTFVNQHENYLELGVVNMSADKVTLPALHGVGGPETPAMFLVTTTRAPKPGNTAGTSGGLRIGGEWESTTLFPNESFSFSLSWADARRLYELPLDCSDVIVSYGINGWVGRNKYYSGEISSSEDRICPPQQ